MAETRLSGVLIKTGSIPTSAINNFSAEVSSSIPPGVVSSSAQIDVRNTTGIQTIATTGSNTFRGNQIVTGSVNITGSTTNSAITRF